MNQSRIWLVVKPTVGLPLFLGTVLVISLVVHFAVLSHTTWVSAFFQGGSKAAPAAAVAAPASTVAAAN